MPHELLILSLCTGLERGTAAPESILEPVQLAAVCDQVSGVTAGSMLLLPAGGAHGVPEQPAGHTDTELCDPRVEEIGAEQVVEQLTVLAVTI